MMTRETLGRVVRQVWCAWASEQPDPKPSWLTPWETLDAGQREVDMRIADAVVSFACSVSREELEAREAELPRLRAALAERDGEIARLRAEVAELRRRPTHCECRADAERGGYYAFE